MKSFKSLVKNPSSTPIYAAIAIEMTITSRVKRMACRRVGQLTCFISVIVSLMY